MESDKSLLSEWWGAAPGQQYRLEDKLRSLMERHTHEPAQPAETSRKGCGGGKDLALFSPVGKKVEVMLQEGPRKSLFLVGQGKTEPSWGLGGGWVDEDLGRENLVPYEGANSGSLLQWQLCPLGWGGGEEGRGPQVGGTEQRTSREEWVGGQKTQIFQEEQGRW